MTFNHNDFYHKLKFFRAINDFLYTFDHQARDSYLNIIEEINKLNPEKTAALENILQQHKIYVEDMETAKNRYILKGLDTIEIPSSYLFTVLYSQNGNILQTIEIEAKINLKNIHTLRLLMQPELDIAILIGDKFSSILANKHAYIKNLDNPEKQLTLKIEEDFIYDDVQICDRLLFKLSENSLIFIPNRMDIENGDYVEVGFMGSLEYPNAI